MKKLTIRFEDRNSTTDESTTSTVLSEVTKVHGKEVPSKVKNKLSAAGSKVREAEVGSRLGYGLFVVPTKGAIVASSKASRVKEAAKAKLVAANEAHHQRQLIKQLENEGEEVTAPQADTA